MINLNNFDIERGSKYPLICEECQAVLKTRNYAREHKKVCLRDNPIRDYKEYVNDSIFLHEWTSVIEEKTEEIDNLMKAKFGEGTKLLCRNVKLRKHSDKGFNYNT